MATARSSIAILLCAGFLSCSSVPKKGSHDSASSSSPPSTDTQREQEVEIKATQQQLVDAQKRVVALSSHVASLEKKIDEMKSRLDIFFANQPANVAAIAHPAEGEGTEAEVPDDPHDPEAGFVHDDAVQAYRKAMASFNAGKYSDGILAFSSFLEKYPDHPLAGSAQYFVGESYFKQKEYKMADQNFQRVLVSYDRSIHVPDTLRDMADAEDALGNAEAAAKHRQLLTSLFSQSPASQVQPSQPSQPAPRAAASQPGGMRAAQASLPAAGGGLDQPPPPTAPLENSQNSP